MRFINKVLAVLLVGLLSFSASATTPPTIDVTDALSSLTAAETAIATIGAAILALAGLSLAWRWAKASFF